MSDIGMPAGFNLFVISLLAATVSVGLMLAFLLINFFVQRTRPFARRLPFRLLIGTLLTLALAIIAAIFTDTASMEWRQASDRVHEGWYVAIYTFSLVLGLFLGSRL